MEIDSSVSVFQQRWCAYRDNSSSIRTPRSSESESALSNDSEDDFRAPKKLYSPSNSESGPSDHHSTSGMNPLPPTEKDQFPPLMTEPLALIDGQMRWQLDQFTLRYQQFLASSPGVSGGAAKVSSSSAIHQQVASLEQWPTSENYIVIGVLGKKGVGKSLLLNSLLHFTTGKLQRVLATLNDNKVGQNLTGDEKREARRRMVAQLLHRELSEPFPVAPHFGQMLTLKCCTRGVQMFATSEGLILLDIQPLLSMSHVAESVRGEIPISTQGNNNNASASRGAASMSTYIEPPASTQCTERNVRLWARGIALRLASFAFNVCDAVLLVEESVCDQQLHSVLNSALMLRPILYRHGDHVPAANTSSQKAANGRAGTRQDGSEREHEPVKEHCAALLCVLNKCPVAHLEVEQSTGRVQQLPSPLHCNESVVQTGDLFAVAEPAWRARLTQEWSRQFHAAVQQQTSGSSSTVKPVTSVETDKEVTKPAETGSGDTGAGSHGGAVSLVSIPRHVTLPTVPLPRVAYHGVPYLEHSDTYGKSRITGETVFHEQISKLWDAILTQTSSKRPCDRNGKPIHMRKWVSYAGEVWKHILESPLIEEYLNMSPIMTAD